MNISAAELILSEADDLLAKACINEKGQKTLIKRLASEEREEIVNECSATAALKAILNQTFLATPEGRKLARDLIRKVGINLVWKNVKINIKTDSTTKRFCFHFGQTLVVLWNKLEREDSGKEPTEEKRAMEERIFEDLFQLSICTPRKFSEKFLHIIQGIVDEKATPGRNSIVGQMLFRTSTQILWQALDATNMMCRYNAVSVFHHLFPMDAAPEENLDYDLKDKQHQLLLQLLKDDCYQIRVDTVKAIFKHLSLCWPMIKPFHRKEYLAIVIDQMAFDETSEVRLAIYESFPQVYSWNDASKIVKHALSIIAPPGLNDPKDKIRLATVNALIKLQGCSIPLNDVISLEELLACFDIETCETIEIAMAQLLFPVICRKVNSFTERFHEVENMCGISRFGSLKFHSIIGSKKIISNEETKTHIKVLVGGIISRLGKNLDDTSSNASTVSSSNDTEMEFNDYSQRGVDFTTIKTLFDCAVVLYLSCRTRLNDDPDAKYIATVVKSLGHAVKRILDDRYKGTIIGESALVAASFLPDYAVDTQKFSISKEIMQRNCDDEYLNYYVMTYASWNMDNVIGMIERGLMNLAKKLKLDKKIHQKRGGNLNSDNLVQDSSRDKDRKPIEMIAIILSSPPTNQLFMEKNEVFAQKFHGILNLFVKNMPSLIDINPNQELLWTRIYEVYSLLTIAIKSQANNETEEDGENERDTFEDELHWFYQKFNAKELTPSFVLKFITLAKYHFDCNQQKEASCESIITFCNHISSFVEASEISADLTSKITVLQKAAVEAFPFSKKEPELAVIQEAEEEEEMPQNQSFEPMDIN